MEFTREQIMMGGGIVAACILVLILYMYREDKENDQTTQHESPAVDVVRTGSAVYAHDKPMSFAEYIRAGNLVPEFLDTSGNMSFAAVRDYQHPPSKWFLPSQYIPTAKGGESNVGTALQGHDDDREVYALACNNQSCGMSGKCDPSSGNCNCDKTSKGKHCHLPSQVRTDYNIPVFGI